MNKLETILEQDKAGKLASDEALELLEESTVFIVTKVNAQGRRVIAPIAGGPHNSTYLWVFTGREQFEGRMPAGMDAMPKRFKDVRLLMEQLVDSGKKLNGILVNAYTSCVAVLPRMKEQKDNDEKIALAEDMLRSLDETGCDGDNERMMLECLDVLKTTAVAVPLRVGENGESVLIYKQDTESKKAWLSVCTRASLTKGTGRAAALQPFALLAKAVLNQGEQAAGILVEYEGGGIGFPSELLAKACQK